MREVKNAEEEEEEEEEFSEASFPSVSEDLDVIRVVNQFSEARGGSSKIVTEIISIERNL